MATINSTGLGTAFKTNPAGTTAIDFNTSTAQDQLGRIMVAYDATYGEKWFMYVKAKGAITKGQTVIMTSTPYVVKADTTGTASLKIFKGQALGVCTGSLNDAYYGWIQVRGYNTGILASPHYCTSACQWTYLASAGVLSIGTLTRAQYSACVWKQFTGIFTYAKVASGKSTSGYIQCI